MLTNIYMLNGIYALSIYTAWSLEFFYDCWCIHAAEPVELPKYQASLCMTDIFCIKEACL